MEISIPKEHHRFVLGKNGAKLKSLENLTATRITVPRHDDPTDFIKITGTKEGLDRARHEIQMISDEQVPSWVIAMCGGSGGGREMVPRSVFHLCLVCCLLYLTASHMHHTRAPPKCTCTHTRTHAHMHTHTPHTHTYTPLTHTTHTCTRTHTHAQAKLAFERLEVEKKFHPFINSQAKALSDQTGTRINIPPPSVDRADITVAGEKEGVAKAVAAIKVLYEELVSTSGTRSADWRCTACTHV